MERWKDWQRAYREEEDEPNFGHSLAYVRWKGYLATSLVIECRIRPPPAVNTQASSERHSGRVSETKISEERQ